jgi:hypothetical protein
MNELIVDRVRLELHVDSRVDWLTVDTVNFQAQTAECTDAYGNTVIAYWPVAYPPPGSRWWAYRRSDGGYVLVHALMTAEL